MFMLTLKQIYYWNLFSWFELNIQRFCLSTKRMYLVIVPCITLSIFMLKLKFTIHIISHILNPIFTRENKKSTTVLGKDDTCSVRDDRLSATLGDSEEEGQGGRGPNGYR